MKFRWMITVVCGLSLIAAMTMSVYAADQIKVLAITKSAGFQHDVVKRQNNELGFAEKILVEIGKKNNMVVTPTKDGSLINPEKLKEFNVLFFYTTGELQDVGKEDASPAMKASDRGAILDFVKNGGGFVGSHTCADTFHNWEENGKKPYIDMIGGEFATHGAQEEGSLKITEHPITAFLDKSKEWALQDEWYMFKNVNNTLKPLLTLQTKKMKQEKYNTVEPYTVCGVKDFGKGKVFICALGHREDVWTSEKFQQLMVNGIKWSAGKLEK